MLVRIEHVDGRLIEPEILTEATFKELCKYTNPSHEPHAVEILSLHELCLMYEQGIVLGHVAGELMAIESWMDFPVLVTVVIIERSKLDTIVKVRQDYRQNLKKREPVRVDIFKQGQLDLQDELDQVKTHKKK